MGSALDVERAGEQVLGLVWKTPVIRSERLDAASGVRLWLKAENFQRGGSFKLRGAIVAVTRLAASGSRGLIVQSTGNHAISVAIAGRECGLPTTVVLPTDASPVKVRRLRELGASVHFAGTTLADRLDVLSDLYARHGHDIVDPYEDPDVVVGQGTATAELVAQVAAEGHRLNAVVVPVGGGSAIAGACLAAPGISIIAAEPRAVPAFTAALRAGAPVTVAARPTIADGLRPDRIGDLPFEIARDRVADTVVVDEAAIAAALRAALMDANLLVEPAAATALAVALERAADLGSDVGVLLTGGNIEPALLADLTKRTP